MEPIAIAVISLIGMVVGAPLLELVKKMLGKPKEKDDAAKSLRDEIRADLKSCKEDVALLRKEIDQLESEVEHWREKYFTLQIEHSMCRVCDREHVINTAE